MPAFKFADPEFRTRLEASLIQLTPDSGEDKLDLAAVKDELANYCDDALVIRFVGRISDVAPMRTVRMYWETPVWGSLEQMLSFIEEKMLSMNMLDIDLFDVAVEIDYGDEDEDALDDEDEAPRVWPQNTEGEDGGFKF